MSPPPPVLLRQLLPAIILLSLCRSVQSEWDIIYLCPIECGTYASGGTYESNLEELLYDIYDNTPFTGYTTSHGDGAGEVFGTARCDDSTTCEDCIDVAITALTDRCSGKLVGAALVVDWGCKLQYANCDTCYMPVDVPANFNGTWPPPGYKVPALPPNCLVGGSRPPPPSEGARGGGGAGHGSGKKSSKSKLAYILPPVIAAPLVLGAILTMFLLNKAPVHTGATPPVNQNVPLPASHGNVNAGDPQQFAGQWSTDNAGPTAQIGSDNAAVGAYSTDGGTGTEGYSGGFDSNASYPNVPGNTPTENAAGNVYAGDPQQFAGQWSTDNGAGPTAQIGSGNAAAGTYSADGGTGTEGYSSGFDSNASYQNAPANPPTTNAAGNVCAGDPQHFAGPWSTDNAGPAAQIGSDNAATGTYSVDGGTGTEGYSGGFDSNASYLNVPANPPTATAAGSIYAGNHQQFPAQWSPAIVSTAAPATAGTYSAGGGMGMAGYSGFNSGAVYWNAPAMAIPAAGFVGERAVRNTPISEHPVGAERPRSGEGGQGGVVYDQGSSSGTDQGGRCCPVIVPLGSRRKPRRRGREESP